MSSDPLFLLEGHLKGQTVVRFGIQRGTNSAYTLSFLAYQGHPGAIDFDDDSGGSFDVDEVFFLGAAGNPVARLQTVSPDAMTLTFQDREKYGGGLDPSEGKFHAFDIAFAFEHPLLDPGSSPSEVQLVADLPTSNGSVVGGNQFPFALTLRWDTMVSGDTDFFQWTWLDQWHDQINGLAGQLSAHNSPFPFDSGNVRFGFDAPRGWFRVQGDYSGGGGNPPAIFTPFFPFGWSSWSHRLLTAVIPTAAAPGTYPQWAVYLDTKFGDVLRVWNTVIAQPILAGLQQVSAGNPVSFVPVFRTDDPRLDQINYYLRFTVQRSSVEDTTLGWLGVELEQAVDGVGATFPNFPGEEAGSTVPLAGVFSFAAISLDSIEPKDGFLILVPTNFLMLQGDGTPRLFAVRDGALRFDLGGSFEGGLEVEEQSVAAALLDRDDGSDLLTWKAGANPRVGAALRMENVSFPVRAVGAAGQDAVAGESARPLWRPDPQNTAALTLRSAPVMLTLSARPAAPTDAPAPAPPPVTLALSIDESTTPLTSHRFTLQLRGHATEGDAALAFDPVLVLDPEPFQVALVWPVATLADDAAGDDDVLARRESGGAWTFAGLSAKFALVLPPPVLGEAMEKVAGGADIGSGQLADMRLSAPAIARLEVTRLSKRYIAAPWNLRRLLGLNGDVAGASLDQLDFELIYGLGCRVLAQPLRLADLFARVGAPASVLEELEFDATSDQGNFFDVTYLPGQIARALAFRRRLGAMELFQDGNPGPLLVVAADAGDTAVIWQPRVAPAADGKSVNGAQLVFPLLAADTTQDPELQKIQSQLHVKATDGGLAGGFPWAFESAAIYKEFWRNPRSSSGILRDVYLSALGAWGGQTARFSNDKTIIQGRTAAGRTHYYTLERIGRIGVFWHRAKHVIVFERTTAPARQFRDQQDPHLGRPIIRKVKEYVEILQPDRPTQDFSESNPVAAGFVLGCTFHNRIIPVFNGWSNDLDIPDPDNSAAPITGWEIPLWQPGADPEVYPKPHVVLHVATDPATGTESVPVAVENPDQLYFYTDTRDATGADTDRWDPIPGVDFPEVPEPLAAAPGTEGSLADTLPEPPSVQPGLERFTFAVGESEQQVNITHQRVKNHSLNAVLRNVTMMRSASRAAIRPAAAGPARDAFDARDKVISAGLRAIDGFSAADALIRSGKPFAWPDLEQTLWDHVNDWLPLGQDQLLQQLQALPLPPLPTAYDTTYGTPNPPCPMAPGPLHILAWNQAATHAGAFQKRTLALLRDEGDAFIARLQTFSGAQWTANLANEVDAMVAALRGRWERFESGAQPVFEQPGARLDQLMATARKELAALVDDALAFPRQLEQEQIIAAGRLDAARQALRAADARVGQIFALLQTNAEKITAIFGVAPAGVDAEITKLKTAWAALIDPLTTWAGDAAHALQTLHAIRAGAEQLGVQLLSTVAAEADALHGLMASGMKTAQDGFQQVAQDFTAVFAGIEATLQNLKAAANLTVAQRTLADLTAPGGSLDTTLKQALQNALQQEVLPLIRPLCGTAVLPESLQELIADPANFARNFLEGLDCFQRVKALGNNLGTQSDEARAALRGEVQRLGEAAGEELRRVSQPVLEAVPGVLRDAKVLNAFGQEASRTLRAARAFGDALIAPGLGFNRKTLTYLLGEGKSALDMTPCAARLKEFGESLEALGLRLPTRQVLDRLIPHELEKFGLSEIISDIGGLRLTDLFPSLSMPPLSGDAIKVTHGIDRETLRAWATATVNLPLGGSHVLFSLGPVVVSVNNPTFTAQVTLSATAQGVQKTAVGALVGDWQLTFAGADIMAFVQTRLRFENGQMHFDLQPNQVRLAGLLQIISDLLPSGGGDDDDDDDDDEEGFHLGLLKGEGIPAGMRAALLLPDIAVGGGTTSVTGLQLGAFFELRFLREVNNAPSFDFSISTGLNVGRPEKPFNIAIFILGGGGYVVTTVSYHPFKKDFEVSAQIGLDVSATLEFALGPIEGGVGIYLGMFLNYYHATGSAGSGSLTVGISFLLEGNVSVLGIVEVSLSVMLDGSYDSSTGKITGTGSVHVEVKICWCFSISVSASVSYSFGGGGGGGGGGHELAAGAQAALVAPAHPLAADPYLRRATDYVDLME